MVQETDRELIKEWFGTREVVDDDMFNTYFNRVLNRDYGQYRELLRIQAGLAKVDWNVVNYVERLVNNKAKKTGSTTASASGTSQTTQSKAGSGSSDVSDTSSGSSVNNAQSASNGVSNGSSSTTTNGNTGNEHQTVDGDESENYVKDIHNMAYADVDTDVPGDYKATQETIHGQGYTDETKTMRNQGTATIDTGASKTMPQSMKSMGSASAFSGAQQTIGVGNPDMTAELTKPSAIQKTTHAETPLGNKADTSTTSRTYDMQDKDGNKLSDKVINSATGKKKQQHSHRDGYFYNSDGELTKADGQNYNKQEKSEHTKDSGNDHSEANTANVQNAESNDNSHSETVDARTGSRHTEQNDNSSATASTTNANSNEGTSQEDTEGDTEEVVRERLGGKTVAQAWKEASSYIKASNAWIWLMDRLEICFMQIL